MAEYALDKKYPYLIKDINVTKERDFGSYYIDEQKNYKYNIFIDIDEEDNHMKLKIAHLVENTLKSMGVSNRLFFYWN
jgi:uncharacterized protein (DUF2147 family)